MRPGLKIIQVPGRYYAATLVGWVYRVHGDEYEIAAGAFPVAHKNGQPWRGLGWLAANGLGQDYQASGEPSEAVEEVNRVLVRRSLRANSKNWPECPRPKNWKQLLDPEYLAARRDNNDD